MKKGKESDPEIAAISDVYKALSQLGPDAQKRVLEYVSRKLGLSTPSFSQVKEQAIEEAESDNGGEKTRETGGPPADLWRTDPADPRPYRPTETAQGNDPRAGRQFRPATPDMWPGRAMGLSRSAGCIDVPAPHDGGGCRVGRRAHFEGMS